MNEWSQKTLQLVTTQNYLDRLQEVYPHEENEREIDETILNSIKLAFDERNDINLLNRLLDLDKFPYKDSYVGFLRKDRTSIERNPITVTRILNHIYEKEFEEIARGVTESMEANRRRGHKFSEWARRNYRLVRVEEFRSSREGIVLLDASEREAKDFCNQEMGVAINKRPDLVAKSGNYYVIGEAKFLSQSGGSQDRGFDDGMTLVRNTSGRAYKVFIMDGVYWITPGTEKYEQIVYGNHAIFSVLLLTEFLQNLA